MKVLGIDPGIALLGYAIMEDGEVIKYGCIKTKSTDPMDKRLFIIFTELLRIMQSECPKVMSIEKLLIGRNRTTAVAVAQARGVCLLAAAYHNLEIYEPEPSMVKKAMGNGSYDKKEMRVAVRKTLGVDIAQDDTADAVAIAYCYGRA